MQNNNKDLTSGNILYSIIVFTIPVLIGIVFQQLYTTIDGIIIGRFAGKEALASIESVFPVIKLPVNFFTGLSTGATIIISNFYGGKDLEQVSDMSHTAVIFSFVGGIFVSVLGIVLAPFAIQLVQVPENIIQGALWYTIIYFSGLGFSMIYNIATGIFRAVGNSKVPLYFLFIANLLNIILDVIFIAILNLGVAGASLATTLSQLISALLILKSLKNTNLPCKINFNNFSLNNLKNNYTKYINNSKKIIKLGLPTGIQYTIYPIANTLIQTNINSLGVDAITAWAVCGKLDLLVWNTAEAFGVTTSTFVAQNEGCQQYKRGEQGVTIISLLSLISTAFISIILFYNNYFLANFLVQDDVVLKLVGDIFYILAPLYILYPLGGGVFPAAIRARGKTVVPMIITLFGTCVIRIIWLLVVVPINKTLITILLCYPITWFIVTTAFWLYYKKLLKTT
ncbi:MAG: MATE family efflux transporter [bacterium]